MSVLQEIRDVQEVMLRLVEVMTVILAQNGLLLLLEMEINIVIMDV